MKCYNPTNVFGSEYPCGYCYACKLNQGSIWGQRMMNEAKLHKKNVFVTLTYDEKNVPSDGKLVKRDVQLFLKKLRKKVKVRYYLAGEYGDKNKRPHYHAVLFGLGADDHKTIEKAWGKGFISVGDVTDDSCKYVAGYVTKKLKGVEKRYFEYTKEGEGYVHPFALMSRKPGIGAEFCDKYGKGILERGFAIVNGNQVPIPRYYLDRVIKKNPEMKLVREGEMYVWRKEKQKEKKLEIKEIGQKESDKKVLDKRYAAMHNCIGKLKIKERSL